MERSVRSIKGWRSVFVSLGDMPRELKKEGVVDFRGKEPVETEYILSFVAYANPREQESLAYDLVRSVYRLVGRRRRGAIILGAERQPASFVKSLHEAADLYQLNLYQVLNRGDKIYLDDNP